jgi:AcrR family transcriptional regulator
MSESEVLAVDGDPREHTRRRIVEVAAELLARQGREAVTTRAVAERAGVQAPTIYRLFGDKDGLLDAMAEWGFQTYLAGKVNGPSSGDPVDDLRAGWDLHVAFGLANPGLYTLMYGDPRPGRASPAAVRAASILRAHIGRVAAAGRLKVREEQAANLMHASGCGTVLALLALPEGQRDLSWPPLAREATIAAITTDSPVLQTPGPVGAAVALRAVLPGTTVLTDGERTLMREWLDRVAAS